MQRKRYRDELIATEGAETFEAFQDFLDAAVSMAAERRLSRWVFHPGSRGRPVLAERHTARLRSACGNRAPANRLSSCHRVRDGTDARIALGAHSPHDTGDNRRECGRNDSADTHRIPVSSP
jgi:hypothetical protein